ncbi:unnamed protein product [Citrullus colocynthis]|uniref:Uncharacterized protein n=1 Tax=Citrullus colocynthis TaxID=252529 RepID=A0ABP0Z1W4_9ROSI
MEEEETKQSLKSPLIPPPLPPRDGGSFTRDEIWAEVKKQLRLAGPLMTVNLLINCLQMISVMFVGHLGQLLSPALPWLLPSLPSLVSVSSLNTSYMIYMIPLGISGAVSTRVSNELGGRRAKAAILAGRVAMGMVATEGAIAAIIIIIGRTLWGYCYSTDHIVVGYLAQILTLLAILHIFDGIQSIFSGSIFTSRATPFESALKGKMIIRVDLMSASIANGLTLRLQPSLEGITRGCGRQKIGAFINLGAYYFVGIPMAILLAFFQGIGGKVKKAADRVTSSMPENLLE